MEQLFIKFNYQVSLYIYFITSPEEGDGTSGSQWNDDTFNGVALITLKYESLL